ncbi:MAG: hypothetical protein KL787_04850 [Taibaiella sp.]|nr:hypothetical protein [Taibaiella sp.]
MWNGSTWNRKRPILHGLAGDLNPETIRDLSNEDKIPYILKMVGADTLSTRMKASMMEVEQSINTWPQLASSVVLGGAVTTDVVRRIFLGQYHKSGRYYIDLEELIGDKTPAGPGTRDYGQEAPAPMDTATMDSIISLLPPPADAGTYRRQVPVSYSGCCHSCALGRQCTTMEILLP